MSNDFKMAPTPNHCGDETINQLWEGGPALPTEISAEDISRANVANALELWDKSLAPARAFTAACKRLEEIMHQPPEPTSVPELFFHTNKRHQYEFTRVPLGHDLGYACYDKNKYDGDPADGNCTVGYGKTEDEAYVDYLNQIEDEKPAPRSGMVVHSSPFEPPTVIDITDRTDED